MVRDKQEMDQPMTRRQEKTHEEKLLDDLYRGREAFAEGATISTSMLREHLLEIVDLNAQGGVSRKSSARWAIHNAVFEEPWDLRDARRAGGDSLPAIEFHDCHFHNGFRADGARLDRLWFIECTFTSEDPEDNCISLRNCNLKSELHIDRLKADPGTLLWVDAFAIIIGGNLAISNSELRAPQTKNAETPETRYALNLATATVKCNVNLTPNVFLYGGVNLEDAHIRGSISANGLYADHGETHPQEIRRLNNDVRNAFGARRACIGGSLLLADKTSAKFHCDGNVDLTSIRVEGEVLLSGKAVRIEGLLDVADARLTKLTILGEYGPPDQSPERAQIDIVKLENCRISGVCYLVLKCDTLFGTGLEVQGDLSISGQVRAEKKSSDKEPELDLKEGYVLQLEGCRTTGVCNLELDCESLYLKGLEVGGDLNVCDAAGPKVAGRMAEIHASGPGIHRNILPAPHGLRWLNLSRAVVGGALDISETRFVSGAHADLSYTRCGSLRDNAGRSWKEVTELGLENFSYEAMALPKKKEKITPKEELEHRLKWITGSPGLSPWKRLWKTAPQVKRPFRAQPYAQLAKVFRQRGEDESARRVEERRILIEKCGSQSTPLRAKVWWRLYGLFFGFGLSPSRAFLTLLFLWLAASLGFDF